jgi:hypothetical protein
MNSLSFMIYCFLIISFSNTYHLLLRRTLVRSVLYSSFDLTRYLLLHWEGAMLFFQFNDRIAPDKKRKLQSKFPFSRQGLN